MCNDYKNLINEDFDDEEPDDEDSDINRDYYDENFVIEEDESEQQV